MKKGSFIIVALIAGVIASTFALKFGHSSAQTTIPIGVDAYQNQIASQPAGLTYVYKYITPGAQNIVTGYISAAYASGKKPVLVVYTNYDSTTPDWATWDGTMNAIRQDGRTVDVVVEPDMFGYIRNANACATTGKQTVDRMLSTAPSNAVLGFFMSAWNLPYSGAASEAASWKSCWLAAGGDRMPALYSDVSDRDQEYKSTYPWAASKIQMFEDWWKAISTATGRKMGVWQIPMGNSTCANGRRSTFVESWLTQSKLTELSPYVDKLLFGPGIEDYDSANTQIWNLPSAIKYDCGMFNSKVASLSGAPAPTPTNTAVPPTATKTSTPGPTGTSVPPTATKTATPAPTATSTPVGISVMKLEAEAMSLPSGYGQTYADTAASAGRAMLIWSNATASKAVNLSRAATRLTVWAKGDQCNGAPHMVVTIDGRRVLSTYVASTTWTAYTTPAAISAGRHVVKVTFDNDYYGTCDRNLRTDQLTFSN